MALAERAVMVAELRLDDKMSAGLTKAGRKLDGLGSKAKTAGKAIGVGVAAVGAAAAVGIAAAVRSGISSLQELEDANTATAAALEVSGLAAKITTGQIRDMSNALEDASDAFFDDKDIQRGANALLRFGSLTEENFARALAVSTDLGTRFGTVEEAAANLARAMADPARATRVLRTAGIALTKAEQKKIKALTESGDLASAQAIILGKLEEKTKGAAKAAGGPYTDAMKKLGDAQEDATQALAVGFLPVITEVASFLSEELGKESTMTAIREFGTGLAGALREGVKWARQLPWDAIVDGLKAAAGFAKGLIDAFTSMPPQAQAAIIALAGLNKLSGGAVTGIVGELGKGLIKGVLGMTAGVVHLKAASVVGGGLPGGGGGGAAPVAGGKPAGGMMGKLTGAVSIIGSVAIAAVSIAALAQTFQTVSAEIGQAQSEFRDKLAAGLKTMDTKGLIGAINAIDDQLGAGPINDLILTVTGTKGELQTARKQLVERLQTLNADANAAYLKMTGSVDSLNSATGFGLDKVRSAVSETKTTVASGDARTASRIASLDSATRSGLDGVRGAANSTASAIRNKRWQITVPVTVNNSVSVRAVTNGQTTVARYTGGAQTSRTIL